MLDIFDMHTHSIASGHSYNTIYEMARGAADLGLKALGITEHAPALPGTCHALYFSNLYVVPRELSGVKLYLGAELNIIDYEGRVDLGPAELKRLDIVIASMHPPCLTPGSCKELTHAYICAMENPYVQVIGHPDDGRYLADYEEMARKAKEYHVLLELNNSSLKPGGYRQNSWENARAMLKHCERFGTKVIMNSDAHVVSDVGDHRFAWKLVQETGFPEELVVNGSLEELDGYLQR